MKFRKIAASAAALTMIASAALPMSLSASATTSDSVYTSIEGTKVTTFDKYLVMKSDAVVPDTSFSFTIAPGEAVAGNSGTIPVLAGVGQPKFVLSTETEKAKNDNT